MNRTFNVIQTLSEERQYLWRKAGKKHLNENQRERIRQIRQELDRLWHVYRCELVRPQRRFIEDRVHGDVFCDYVDRLRRIYTAGDDGQNDDWEEIQQIEQVVVLEKPRRGARLPVYETDEPVTVDFMLDVLREVTAALRAEQGKAVVT
jgi:hypothetical protein